MTGLAMRISDLETLIDTRVTKEVVSHMCHDSE